VAWAGLHVFFGAYPNMMNLFKVWYEITTDADTSSGGDFAVEISVVL